MIHGKATPFFFYTEHRRKQNQLKHTLNCAHTSVAQHKYLCFVKRMLKKVVEKCEEILVLKSHDENKIHF